MNIIICILFLISSAAVLQAQVERPKIDEDKVYELFISSEFDSTKKLIGNFIQVHGVVNRTDSIVVLKYLGAIELQNPDSVHRAKHYWRKMLQLNPHATIRDLMLPAEYDDLFNKLKEEVAASKKQKPQIAVATPVAPKEAVQPVQPAEPVNPAKPEPPPVTTKKESKAKKSKAWMWWTAGGVAAAGTVAGVILMSGGERPLVTNVKKEE